MEQNFKPNYRIVKVEDEKCSATGGGWKGRSVWGRVNVPSYLSSGRGSLLSASELDRKPDTVESNGEIEFPFLIRYLIFRQPPI